MLIHRRQSDYSTIYPNNKSELNYYFTSKKPTVMKTTKVFLMGLIAFGLAFTACNTNDDDMPEIEKGEKARVSIRVAKNSVGTRLVDDLNTGGASNPISKAEFEIKSLELWLFNDFGVQEVYEAANETTLLAADDKKNAEKGWQKFGEAFVLNGIETTVGNKYLVMAANANVGSVTNLNELRAKLTKPTVAGDNKSQDIISNGMIMTSLITPIPIVEGENMFGTPPSGHHHDGQKAPDEYNQISVDPLFLTRVNARIALMKLEFEFPDDPIEGEPGFHTLAGFVPVDEFQVTDVVVLNARSQSKLFAERFGSAEATRLFDGVTTKFRYGMLLPPFAGAQYTADEKDADFKVSSPLLPVLEIANRTATGALIGKNKNTDEWLTPYFYVFENNNTPGERTMLIIRGKLLSNGTVLTDQDLPGRISNENPGGGDGPEHYTYYTIFVGNAYGSEDPAGIEGLGIASFFDGTVRRNTQYNFYVTINGPGYDEVGDPSAFLDVLCEVAPWIVADQSIVFN